jgi:hypothetical protein
MGTLMPGICEKHDIANVVGGDIASLDFVTATSA